MGKASKLAWKDSGVQECRDERDKGSEAKRNRSCDEMVIQRKGEMPSARKRGHSQRQTRGEKQTLTDGRSWRQDVQERVTPRERQTDRRRESETDQKTRRAARWGGRQKLPKEMKRQRRGGRDRRTDRPEGCKEGEGEKRVEAGAAGSGGRGAGAAERAGAGSRLVKAARSGEIAARIAELHKTPPARPAAEPAPISSLIAARAGYAFKCYLIGLRRSWGPERPRPRPARSARPGCSPPPQICFPSHRLPRTPLLPALRLPFVSGLLLPSPVEPEDTRKDTSPLKMHENAEATQKYYRHTKQQKWVTLNYTRVHLGDLKDAKTKIKKKKSPRVTKAHKCPQYTGDLHLGGNT